MTLLFANNAYGTLAGPITNTATTANLAAGTGALFPNPTAPDYFKLTFVDAATGLLSEIVHVTARSGDTITIVRGRESTNAQNWLAGDLAQNLWTAGSAQAMLQSVQQSGFFQGTDTASDPNNMTVPTTTAALTAPPAAGQIFFVTKGSNPNTGPVKLLIGTGATAGTNQSVVYGDGAQLAAGDWPGTASAWLYDTGTVYQLLGLVRNSPPVLPTYLVHSGDDTSGTANTITVSNLTPAITAYVKGTRFQIKLANAISGSGAVANIGGLGNRTITRADGTPTQANDGVTGQELDLIDDGTNLQIAGLRTSFLPSSRGVTYGSSTTFTVPPGVYVIKRARVWAGGGGGGNSSGAQGAGSGGGGGGYAESLNIAVYPGQQIAVTVGGGGGQAGAGGSSSFGSYASATGGNGGLNGVNGQQTSGSGSGGNGTGNALSAGGAQGGLAYAVGNVPAGGIGGQCTFGGGSPSLNLGTGGNNGNFPGGGANGGAAGNGGGGGGNGLVAIEF